MKKLHVFFIATLTCVLISCTATKNLKTAIQPVAENINSLKLIGQYVVPNNYQFNKTTVGGLSSIDYDAKNDLYYLVCDDRSDINPARFYAAKIFVSANGIDSVDFKETHALLQPNGNVYPNRKQDPLNTPDPEAMRYDPLHNRLIWSSEGERIVNAKDTVLLDPSINIVATDGKSLGSFPLPGNLKMNAFEKGPRQNGVLEGMTFADNYKTLFVNVEEPMYEDGPRADVVANNAFIRILKFDVQNKKNTAQYAYKLDPVAHPAQPSTAFKINGIPDILWIGKNKFLVVERSFSTGRLACTIKVFLTNIEGATNIIDNNSLIKDPNFVAASKKLLLDMDDLGIYIDNVEGVTFGPTLPNGHRTLVFIADNNFSLAEKSQIFLFEIE